jgi:hypothetical protein
MQEWPVDSPAPATWSAPSRIAVHLPADSTQGPDTWYILRLRVAIVLDGGWVPSPTDSILVSGFLGESIGVQLKLQGDLTGVTWSSIGYAEGPKSEVANTKTPNLELQYENYVQGKGFAGGDQEFRLSLHSAGDHPLPVVSATVLPGSAIVMTHIPPDSVSLRIDGVDKLPARTSGESRARIRYSVSSVRHKTQDLGNVKIVIHQSDRVTVESVEPTELVLKSGEGRGQVLVSFPIGEVSSQVDLVAENALNDPVASVALGDSIDSREGNTGRGLLIGAMALGLCGIIVLSGVVVRRGR